MCAAEHPYSTAGAGRRLPHVAMLGGTFDPVHLGHLRSAVELRMQLGLDCVHMIPAHVPPHRAAPGVSSAERLAMLRAGIGDTPGLYADDRELRREGPSYSVDTLRSLREEYGDEARLVMVVGHDAFLKLAHWQDPKALFDIAHVVVIARPDHAAPLPQALQKLIDGREVQTPEALFETPEGRLMQLALPSRLAVSATAIRRWLQQGESVRYLLPEPVLSHITRAGLYRSA
ncbi:nicotinate-nucleotide adenylyltransferase [Onishia niordana]|uniref:nicotinate-nucleotide adenylyltransferase n=1 Tax=Onishia niordana TaxID=2508711 RepID=UPI00109F2469|nr:nicotinate-nucleotide adenylyltransferase [Halomonas niordiana]